MRVFISYPLDTAQTQIVLSVDPEANCFPFGENTTLFIQLECP